MKKAAHSLLLSAVASAIILPAIASPHDPIRGAIQIRAVGVPDSSVPALETTPAGQTTAQTSAAGPSTVTSPSSPANSPTTSGTSPPGGSATTTHASSGAASPIVPAASSVVPTTATDAAGQVITTFVTAAAAPSTTPSPTNTPDNSGGGLSTGSIIGLSVAGGIAALGIILFFVWKFTRKRFSDFDDNEAIKWPELNAHNTDVHALPTNSTGRAGFGPENDSDLNLARAPSPGGGYATSIAASSVPEMYGTGDPYAIPPLPHLNPNQPYRDEPGAYGQPAGYYDPYRGPVPNTFADAISEGHGAESIPMTQMARGRSPGPQAAYDMQGRGSPTPQAAMSYVGMDERSRTPNPAGYGYGPR